MKGLSMAAGIRAIQPHDYESAMALFIAAYPERARETNTWALAEQQEAARRWVVTDETSKQVLGYGAIWRVRPGKFRMDLIVHLDWRRRGIGTHILNQLVEGASSAGAATLQARADDNADESLTFLERRGFAETMQMHRLVLRVAEADLTPFSNIEAQLAACGIVITTLHDEQIWEPALWEKFFDLYNDVRHGWPDPDPGGPPATLTVDECRDMVNRFGLVPESFFIAKQGDAYLGFTGGVGTGVRPACRNQGIATALKVRAIASARERNREMIHTSSGNPAMVRVNEKLGFRRVSTEVRLVKSLDPAEKEQPLTEGFKQPL